MPFSDTAIVGMLLSEWTLLLGFKRIEVTYSGEFVLCGEGVLMNAPSLNRHKLRSTQVEVLVHMRRNKRSVEKIVKG